MQGERGGRGGRRGDRGDRRGRRGDGRGYRGNNRGGYRPNKEDEDGFVTETGEKPKPRRGNFRGNRRGERGEFRGGRGDRGDRGDRRGGDWDKRGGRPNTTGDAGHNQEQ